ncbi:chymotrypsin inhibitor Ani s 6-like [Uranotaenia lowii]|uniref:chymotrypsin inhibitor Ani s 6-like n=1 Tax=Uranotaenia lowii TaxID=190385 RepID=UPI00247856AD|nr:chymotrypsin inhibitor Ani s 6-like [Uranotaenia lowii]
MKILCVLLLCLVYVQYSSARYAPRAHCTFREYYTTCEPCKEPVCGQTTPIENCSKCNEGCFCNPQFGYARQSPDGPCVSCPTTE